jgi:CheY-like chemotaxis protein
MPAIAVVDDRRPARETIAKVIASTIKALGLSETWAVVDDAPPPKERDVLQWMDQHDATVLLTDWRLNEGSETSRAVNYEAGSLIDAIRVQRPSFPIFVITGYVKEAAERLRDVEAVFERSEFTKRIETILPQMLRSGARRYKEQRELFGELDSLSRKMARGKATGAERKRLSSLQGYFQTDIPMMTGLEAVLTELEAVTERAEEIQKKLQKQIKKKGKK